MRLVLLASVEHNSAGVRHATHLYCLDIISVRALDLNGPDDRTPKCLLRMIFVA